MCGEWANRVFLLSCRNRETESRERAREREIASGQPGPKASTGPLHNSRCKQFRVFMVVCVQAASTVAHKCTFTLKPTTFVFERRDTTYIYINDRVA